MTTRTTRFNEIPGLEGVTVVRHAGPTPTDARHLHDSLCVGAVESGERTVRVDGGEFTARAGDVIILAPGRVHACPDRGTSEYVMIAIPTARLGDFGKPVRTPAEPVADDPVLFGMVLSLAELAETRTPVMERQGALLALLERLARIGQVPPVETEEEAEPEPERIRSARSHLQTHFAEEVRLEDLAATAGCSPGRLNRAFARSVGMPPHEYQTLLRIREAKRMLRNGMPLADAALEAGFFDQSHMNRCFAKVMGMTPGTYVRGMRQPRS
ncbi:AraC family transcriptional regulator [Pseudodesulfovibrio sp.]|uniref:AraC family transcriptional regulator n=1 Tax=unclassified Pseudodesulfovibrio TaxID=2661612 RepID=UPI003B00B9CF